MKLMREIKFRAFNETRNEWFYFVIEPTDKNLESTISFGSPVWRFLKKEGLSHWGQFTGLADKHGKEIYEGDIIRIQYEGGPLIGSVKFEDGWFGFQVQETENIPQHFSPFGIQDKPEVIGNIYENPELLKN